LSRVAGRRRIFLLTSSFLRFASRVLPLLYANRAVSYKLMAVAIRNPDSSQESQGYLLSDEPC
jgi:hypothetical protein